MDTLAEPFLAPAPVPHEKPLGLPRFLLTASRNPIEIWGQRAYREPIVRVDWLRVPTIVLSDPAGIRHCLVENSANYALQPLRQRVLRPFLRDGLLTAEGELWRRTRRALSPVFAPRNTGRLAAPMAERSRLFAQDLARRDGEVVDVSTQMTLLTYDILQATLFTNDITGRPAEFAHAMERFLDRMGRVDPLDILDAPAFLPRVWRLMGRRANLYFRRIIAETRDRRRALLARDPASAPQDLLTLLLQTEALSDAEIEDNIITFIGAGHETTARALGWTLYLLAMAPGERALVEAELDALLPGLPDPRDWPEALPHTRAAFEEAMRLYPPAPSLNRTALADDEVRGMAVPAG
ncbi:cytochrome P450, partial [Aureimonas sp. AU4]|uniref:cytochrome P450 n=1 Tax=Aureimonas sp. AU4 TaxID=1638163 RepID=UPI0007835C64